MEPSFPRWPSLLHRPTLGSSSLPEDRNLCSTAGFIQLPDEKLCANLGVGTRDLVCQFHHVPLKRGFRRIMPRSPSRQIWIHALGAKVGGGVTYLNAIIPILIQQLEGKGVRIVLLLPSPWQGQPLPDWFEFRVLQRA